MDWASVTFVVPKKEPGQWRGVVDMRGPNSQTRHVNFPLPKIEDLLLKQGKCQIISILDLKMAFHQQPLDPDSRHITQCYTPDGIYQWRVNVMGLQNASQQFHQMMDDRLQPDKDVPSPYIDDILIGTWVEPGNDLLAAHDRDVKKVLELLKREVFIVGKWILFVKEVEFYGHILGGGSQTRPRQSPGH